MKKRKVIFMNASISKNDFMNALTKVASALPSRATSIYALQNILLEFKEGEGAIRISATDLEVSSVVDSPATVQEEGSLAVIGSKLIESIRELPDDEIILSSSEKNVLNLKSGKTRFNLRGVSREEYPTLPVLTGEKSFKVSSKVLKEAIKKTIIAVSVNEARTFLTGAYFTIVDKKIRLVSTDGHRLALSDITAGEIGKEKKNVSVIIPARILLIAAAAFEPDEKITISLSETHVVFSGETGRFSGRLIVEKFPDYQKIIPKKFETSIKINRQVLLDTLRRVSVYSTGEMTPVSFNVKSGKIFLHAESPEFGDAQDEIEAEVKGPAIETNFNSKFIQDVLKVLTGDELNIEMSSKIAPALFKTDNDKEYIYILMPLRG